MRSTRLIFILLAMMLLGSSYVYAESPSKVKYSDDELIQIMKDDGYASVKQQRKGLIRIKIDGRTYLLLNKSDGDLQTYYAVGGVNLSYEDMNTWNRTKRLSRAYLDTDMDPILESDLLANAGLTAKQITEFFRVFQFSVGNFRMFLIQADQLKNKQNKVEQKEK